MKPNRNASRPTYSWLNTGTGGRRAVGDEREVSPCSPGALVPRRAGAAPRAGSASTRPLRPDTRSCCWSAASALPVPARALPEKIRLAGARAGSGHPRARLPRRRRQARWRSDRHDLEDEDDPQLAADSWAQAACRPSARVEPGWPRSPHPGRRAGSRRCGSCAAAASGTACL